MDMLGQFSHYLMLLAGIAAAGFGGYALRGWLDERDANARPRAIDRISQAVAELEAMKTTGVPAEEVMARRAAESAKIASLKARITGLS